MAHQQVPGTDVWKTFQARKDGGFSQGRNLTKIWDSARSAKKGVVGIADRLGDLKRENASGRIPSFECDT